MFVEAFQELSRQSAIQRGVLCLSTHAVPSHGLGAAFRERGLDVNAVIGLGTLRLWFLVN